MCSTIKLNEIQFENLIVWHVYGIQNEKFVWNNIGNKLKSKLDSIERNIQLFWLRKKA